MSDSKTVDFVKSRLFALDEMAKAEKDAMHSMPNSWREREALRRFEEARNILINSSVNFENIMNAFYLNSIYLVISISLFYYSFAKARKKGTLINIGE